ncbi:hypothetical protein DES53_101581 [Roseimicrobium gellanilyticum]|uniref:Uncharacterized protein n=1 Tax=Roseimicrobium gellanilyticum TaxID=748857 RepID=A0A366HU22_9BACT|nr:hypothetical protein [Roseimicrobium gellanilyticum]RBP47782.1 hypothetical protein DES53_101581 [Roseimicrobium gellanilyticum]
MPDVSLFTATEPVPSDTPVIIRYSVEVGGLPVYNESYDVDKLASELERDKNKLLGFWARRLLCPIKVRHLHGFSAALTRCIADGHVCDGGADPGSLLDSLGAPRTEQISK